MFNSLSLHIYRYVILMFDEMKLQEDLVYDKTGEHLYGFVNLGDVNDHLELLEKRANSSTACDNIATHMLTVMVRGIFAKIEFPYASFPTQGMNILVNYF